MARTAEATAAIEARRQQALERMDRNDALVREVRAGRISELADEAEGATRMTTGEFFSREHEQD